ncbi:hypothetical protein WA158_003962 [Blastocystis sp. Blastoise]
MSSKILKEQLMSFMDENNTILNPGKKTQKKSNNSKSKNEKKNVQQKVTKKATAIVSEVKKDMKTKSQEKKMNYKKNLYLLNKLKPSNSELLEKLLKRQGKLSSGEELERNYDYIPEDQGLKEGF